MPVIKSGDTMCPYNSLRKVYNNKFSFWCKKLRTKKERVPNPLLIIIANLAFVWIVHQCQQIRQHRHRQASNVPLWMCCRNTGRVNYQMSNQLCELLPMTRLVINLEINIQQLCFLDLIFSLVCPLFAVWDLCKTKYLKTYLKAVQSEFVVWGLCKTRYLYFLSIFVLKRSCSSCCIPTP